MAGRVVLVSGVCDDLARRYAEQLVQASDVDLVIGVDAQTSTLPSSAVRYETVDPTSPVIADLIADHGVDTVVHLGLREHLPPGARHTRKESNVIGSMQLFAACQNAAAVKTLVIRSSGAFYGSGSRQPALVTEDREAAQAPSSGFARDLDEVEGYARGLANRRPDLATTVLRTADVIGSQAQTPWAQHLRRSAIGSIFGFDPRLQFLHENDLFAVLDHSIGARVSGTFNVAGEGLMTLSQIARRLGRSSLPVPGFVARAAIAFSPTAALQPVPGQLIDLLTHGRGMDTARMRRILGFSPAFSTAQALDELGSVLPEPARRTEAVVAALEDRVNRDG